VVPVARNPTVTVPVSHVGCECTGSEVGLSLELPLFSGTSVGVSKPGKVLDFLVCINANDTGRAVYGQGYNETVEDY